MSEKKFTPGPWVARYQRDSNEYLIIGNGQPTPRLVAQKVYEKTNADLIAAAPALYEVVRRVVNELEGEHLHEAAVAALAKADGKEIEK